MLQQYGTPRLLCTPFAVSVGEWRTPKNIRHMFTFKNVDIPKID